MTCRSHKHNIAALLATAFFASMMLTTAAADASKCVDLVDDALRLNCYDREAGRTAPPASDSALERRFEDESAVQLHPFAITPYRPNYILPVTYLHNADFSPYYVNDAERGELRNEEVKFQLSLKALLWPSAFGSKVSAWVAFTMQSYWQLYASEVSAPFRETNYEPELFVSAPIDANVWGWRLRKVIFGADHQSNGRSEPLSRSWNRITGSLLLDRNNTAISLRTWWRIPESVEEDDNPNIEDYMGRAEIGVVYRLQQQTFAVLIRNNFRSANKSGVQIDWSFPLLEHLRGYAQLYSGYGENLIDGPNNQTRIGIGVMLTDWL